MFYNSRNRVYNMSVKSERNLSGSRADDLNQLIIFPPYHIVNPRDASLGDLLFFVFSLLWLFCASPIFLSIFVLLRIFSAPYRFFCTDFSFSSLNSVFPADFGLTVFLQLSALLFLADLVFTPLFQAIRARSSAGMLKN